MIGGGSVIPELNFTLPKMSINTQTLPAISEYYRSIVSEAIEHARHMHAPGVIFEFETLLEMMAAPSIGIDLVRIMNEVCGI